MHRRIVSARSRVSKRVGIGIVVLTLLSFALLAATVWLFVGLRDSRETVARSIREDAVWAAFQADREAARLVEAILAAQVTGDVAEISLRFDLLYSRLGLLQSGKYEITFGEESGVGDKAAAVVALVPGLDADVASLSEQGTPSAALLTAMLKDARTIRAATGELIVAANSAVSDLRVAERDASLNTYVQIGLAVAGLLIVLVLIVGLLVIQLRQILQTGRAMERLSEQHAKTALDAEAANRAKSAFLATMSHEIRTPLNAIIGMADLIRLSGLTPDQTSQLGIIRQAGDVLLDVINDILDYSKLEAGAVTIERQPSSLPELMSSVDSIMAPRAFAAGLTFEISHPAVMVTVDAARLRQVLLNLVGNAIKFTRQGSVSVAAHLVGNDLRIEVSDTGPGISTEQFSKLFRDFSQLDSSSTRAFGGTGLGLAICKRLAEAMGGTIGVTSEVGHGSTFWVQLPVAPVSDVVAAAVSAPSPTARAAFSGTVLVVDDNDVNRQVAGGLLRSLGLEVDCAADGQMALDRMAGRRYDLVLMDMQMPVLDGLAATQAARERGDTTPIVGLTANAFQSDRDACIAAGMNDHLAKPVTRDKLARLLGKRWGAVEPPPAIEHPSVPEVDDDQQRTLREELGDAMFGDLVAAFVDDGLRLISDAKAAASSGDHARYDALLHTLKGAALTMGYSRVGAAAAEYRNRPLEDAEGLSSVAQDIKGIVANRLAA